MAYTTAEGRQQLLDTIAEAIDELGQAIALLGVAYEDLDESRGDELKARLFRPVQRAYGRARRAHADFAARVCAPARTFAPPPAPAAWHGDRSLVRDVGRGGGHAQRVPGLAAAGRGRRSVGARRPRRGPRAARRPAPARRRRR